MSSVFSTPVLTPCLRLLAKGALWLSGWRVEIKDPPPPPFVLIGAPHTSNWDFGLMMAALLITGHEARWLGKLSLFRPPFKGLMRWLGGVPVDREHHQNAVSTIAALVRQTPDFILCVAPEGTRRKVERWRTGFYFIALEARIPIVMVAIDAETRTLRLLGHYRPTGDAEHEIPEIQRCFKGFGGLRAENAFAIPD